MLAYLFWHRPLEGATAEDYEQALLAFHRSLAHSPPVGLCGSACFRVGELPWLPGAAALGGGSPGYEDWYVVEDYAALGVLNEAAAGRGHRTSHDRAARRFGTGSGGLYALVEGERPPGRGAGGLGEASLAVWVARPPGSRAPALGELLGDGIEPGLPACGAASWCSPRHPSSVCLRARRRRAWRPHDCPRAGRRRRSRARRCSTADR